MIKLIGLSIVGLFCWIVMFLAGHDVWHFSGSPDFWYLTGPPHFDLRVFATAFYFQFLVLLGLLVAGVWNVLRTERAKRKAG